MPARIVERPDLPVAPFHDQDVVGADLKAGIGPRAVELACRNREQPFAVEDVLKVGGKDVRIGIERPLEGEPELAARKRRI